MEGLGKIVQALKVDWLAVAWSQHLWLGSEEKTNGDHGLIPSAGGTQTRWPAEEDEPLDKPRAIMSAAAKAHTLVQLWAESATATQDAYATRICCQLIAYIMDPIWKVRLAGLEALVPFWERFQGTRGLPDEALSALVEGLVQRASEPRYSIVRIHALQAMRATAVAIKPTDCWSVPVQQRLYAVAKAATQDTNSRVADLATEFLQQHLS
ncbi:hypothetical protein H4R35_005196 [Dimargaris xerosporica]|nr:hypothetical protein H4R35_005196 [Dimargaris xerosporica]